MKDKPSYITYVLARNLHEAKMTAKDFALVAYTWEYLEEFDQLDGVLTPEVIVVDGWEIRKSQDFVEHMRYLLRAKNAKITRWEL